jgi:hypothetical protein
LAVGSPFDNGDGNSNRGAGAVRLFTFADSNFSSGALAATMGSGYRGGKNVNVALDSFDLFGAAVSLNATGDRLAVGASADDGAQNATSESGAAHLFTFSDRNFSGGSLAATLGSGYTGGKNVNVSLGSFYQFGVSVSLNAAGDRLAVGAPFDAGADNTKPGAGAVHLFNFSDRNFTGGTLGATFGSGYSGGKNVNVALDSGDIFGIAVSLNAAGDRLAVGALYDGGANNSNSFTGATYLFTDSINYAFSERAGQTITLNRKDLETILAQGSALSLQASNDITLASALNVNNPSGNGGALTLQAGRSIVLNKGITTDNGNLTLIANDVLANGVVDANRDAGNAVITIASGAPLNAGTGNVNIELRDGAGKSNNSSGNIEINGTISASNIRVSSNGASGGALVINSGAVLSASGPGDALVLANSKGNFINNAGAGALNVTAGRISVQLANPGVLSIENRLLPAPGVAGALTSVHSADRSVRLPTSSAIDSVGRGSASTSIPSPISVVGDGLNLPPGVTQ